MARYKWNSAREWLDQKAQQHAAAHDTAELLRIYNAVVTHVDNDDIQDDFQSEMVSDGFFIDLDIANDLSGKECIEILSAAGEDEAELTDGPETVEQMRSRISAGIEDGSVDYEWVASVKMGRKS